MSALKTIGVVVGVVAAVGYLSGPSAGGVGGCAVATSGVVGGAVAGYGSEQLGHAATIVAVGKRMGAPDQGWVVAVATAMQESGLRNLDHGDRDSLGLFQQRPSQGWGTPEQVMTPDYAATQFYQRLLAVPDWQQMSLTDAAQTVQRSGFPNAYAKHEPEARAVVAAVHGVTCA